MEKFDLAQRVADVSDDIPCGNGYRAVVSVEDAVKIAAEYAADKGIYEIPQEVQEVARELARVAQKYNLSRLSGEFTMHWQHPFRERLQFTWDSGRHGAEMNTLNLHTKFDVTTKVNEPGTDPGGK